VFQKLFPYTKVSSSRSVASRFLGVSRTVQSKASSRGTRVIAVNRRGYAPSTPYTEDEVKLITGDKAAQTQFLQREGHDYATLLAKIVEKYGLGKVAVVAWSMASGWVSAMMGNLDTAPPEAVSALQRHLDTVIIHGTSPVRWAQSSFSL
jgi:pimeloyl-ACP methyl ester carboxylesterase